MPNNLSLSHMTTDVQHFNISEIYLHPSHTKRKQMSPNQNVQNQVSPNEDKDIALLRISSTKTDNTYSKRTRSTEIQSLPNRRRIRHIKTRGGRIATFRPMLTNVSDEPDVGNKVHPVDCDLNVTKGIIDMDFLCKNVTKVSLGNETNHRKGNSAIFEGFPIVLLYPRLRSRQASAVIGCKTAKVNIIL